MDACLFRLLKKAGMHRSKRVASLSRCHIARRILHGVTAQYETDSSAGSGLSSGVDLSSTERKCSISLWRTEFENTQESSTTTKGGPLRRSAELLHHAPCSIAISNRTRSGAQSGRARRPPRRAALHRSTRNAASRPAGCGASRRCLRTSVDLRSLRGKRLLFALP